MSTKNNNIKVKCEIDGNINLYSSCKKFATINEEGISNLLKRFNLIRKCYLIV